MKTFFLSFLLIPSLGFASDFPGEFYGEVALEYRYFPNEGLYGNTEKHHDSAVIRPEYSYSWDNDRNVISTILFARIDQVDSARTHFDVRELSFVASWSQLELRLGISKVFWGVTESQHLVDVINQTDFIENPDSEQKLGQPMVNPTLVTPMGNIELFVLPYFRERTFSGEHGRYRSAVLVDTDRAEYTHEDENRHIDYAIRWSANWADLEWATSYFRGTDRAPNFRLDTASNNLIPVYGQSRQLGLELQHIYKDMLLKAEFLRKESDFYNLYSSATVGFEYTLSNVANTLDIGLLYEWLYDSRDRTSPSANYNASFYGTRLALNDEASTQALVGAIFDNETSHLNVFRIEASQRLNQSLSLSVEVNIVGKPSEHSILNQFREDDYFQISLSAFY